MDTLELYKKVSGLDLPNAHKLAGSPFSFPRNRKGYSSIDVGTLLDSESCPKHGSKPTLTTLSTIFCTECGAAFDYWGFQFKDGKLPSCYNEIWRQLESEKNGDEEC